MGRSGSIKNAVGVYEFSETAHVAHLHFETIKIESYNQEYVWGAGIPINPLWFYVSGPVIQGIPEIKTNDNVVTNNKTTGQTAESRYDAQYGIIKEQQLFTVDYILTLSKQELLALNISNDDILDLANKLKFENVVQYNALIKLLN